MPNKAGVAVTDRSFINVDSPMRTKLPQIFAISDVVRPPLRAHKAVCEADITAEAIAGELPDTRELKKRGST